MPAQHLTLNDSSAQQTTWKWVFIPAHSLLHHLQSLLENPPKSLPLDLTPSQYSFGLDYKTIAKEGVWFAFNQNMEVNFKAHQLWGNGDRSTEPQTCSRCVGQWAKNDENGGWIADNKHEDIWPWNNDGEKWGDKPAYARWVIYTDQ